MLHQQLSASEAGAPLDKILVPHLTYIPDFLLHVMNVTHLPLVVIPADLLVANMVSRCVFPCIFIGRNEVVAKVMFLHVSVILLTGGLQAPPDRENPPPQQVGTPQTRQTPPAGRTPWQRGPPQTRNTPPGSRLQNTVYERPVRILLECIPVSRSFAVVICNYQCRFLIVYITKDKLFKFAKTSGM